jgi:hypothetical protein
MGKRTKKGLRQQGRSRRMNMNIVWGLFGTTTKQSSDVAFVHLKLVKRIFSITMELPLNFWTLPEGK